MTARKRSTDIFFPIIDSERRRRGWSWNQLRLAAGIDQRPLYRYARGEGNISAATLAKLFAALEIEVRPKDHA